MDKVRRAVQEVTDIVGRADHVVTNISERVKVFEKYLTGNQKRVLVGVSDGQGECSKKS